MVALDVMHGHHTYLENYTILVCKSKGITFHLCVEIICTFQQLIFILKIIEHTCMNVLKPIDYHMVAGGIPYQGYAIPVIFTKVPTLFAIYHL